MRVRRRNTFIAGKVQSQIHCPERGEWCGGNPLIGVTVAAVPMQHFAGCTKKQLPKPPNLRSIDVGENAAFLEQTDSFLVRLCWRAVNGRIVG
jgi:hypothetical protein